MNRFSLKWLIHNSKGKSHAPADNDQSQVDVSIIVHLDVLTQREQDRETNEEKLRVIEKREKRIFIGNQLICAI